VKKADDGMVVGVYEVGGNYEMILITYYAIRDRTNIYVNNES